MPSSLPPFPLPPPSSSPPPLPLLQGAHSTRPRNVTIAIAALMHPGTINDQPLWWWWWWWWWWWPQQKPQTRDGGGEREKGTVVLVPVCLRLNASVSLCTWCDSVRLSVKAVQHSHHHDNNNNNNSNKGRPPPPRTHQPQTMTAPGMIAPKMFPTDVCAFQMPIKSPRLFAEQ